MTTLFIRMAVGDKQNTITKSLAANTAEDAQLLSHTRYYNIQTSPDNAEGVWFRLNAAAGGTDPQENEAAADATNGSFRLPPGATCNIDVYPASSVLRMISGASAVVWINPIQPSNPMGGV